MKDHDRPVFVHGIVMNVGLLGAVATRLWPHWSKQEVPLNLDSILFLGGLFGVGIAVFVLAGGRGELISRERWLMGVQMVLAATCLVLADVSVIMDHGLAVSTPFVVAIVMGLLGRRA